MPPKEFEEFHGITAAEKKEKTNFFYLLKHAPKVFWTVGLVQFFCWAAFMYMWTYTNGAIAETVWNTTDVQATLCRTSHWFCYMGNYPSYVQSPETGLLNEPCVRWDRLYLYFVLR